MKGLFQHRSNLDQYSLVMIAIGGNVAGRFGPPSGTVAWAERALEKAGVRILRRSRHFATAPVGIGRQPEFLNAVLAVATDRPPAALLRLLKRLEREAGRRFCRGFGSRPLDLDIVAYRGMVIGRPHVRRVRGSLILPHPEAARRRFVLEPALDVAPPGWSPGRSKATARQVLVRLPNPPGGLRPLDRRLDPCD